MTADTILTKDSILKVKDYKVEVVEVPEWEGNVRLRTLTGKDRDEFEMLLVSNSPGPGKVDIRGMKASLLSMCIVDENDVLMFSKEEVETLNSKSSKVINDLWEVAQRMNGIGEEGLKEAEKN